MNLTNNLELCSVDATQYATVPPIKIIDNVAMLLMVHKYLCHENFCFGKLKGTSYWNKILTLETFSKNATLDTDWIMFS